MAVSVLLVARLLLAGVFLVAGLAKLIDRAGSRQAMVDFGLPSPLAVPLGWLLPITELALVVTLLVASTAWWAAVAAVALLALFLAGIAVNLARGRKPACRCFGQLSAGPIGWSTLVRNGVLIVVAGVVVWQGRTDAGLDVPAWLGSLGLGEILSVGAAAVALALLLGMTWLLFQLWQLIGRLLVRVDELEARIVAGAETGSQAVAVPAQVQPGLPVGSPAPSFRLDGLHGETLTLDALRASRKPVLLLFSDPECGPCGALMPEVGRWQRDHASALALAVVSRGEVEANRSKASEHGLTTVLLQKTDEVAQAYQAYGTPSAVLIQADGVIGSPVALGADGIRALVLRTVGGGSRPLPVLPPAPGNGNGVPGNGREPTRPGVANVGDPAPALKLPDLNGRPVNLTDFRGSSTLVLFWNPGCGFCQQMLSDLKAWEQEAPKGAPKLLVVSTGTAEANRALGLRSPIVLEPSFNIGSSFGVSGTPSAVLVDARGKITSPVAVGAQAVLALARPSSPVPA
jgi:peroxiredoxin